MPRRAARLTRAEMARRMAAGRDPLTNRPRSTCAWSIGTGPEHPDGHAYCGGCGKPVKLSRGHWVYARNGAPAVETPVYGTDAWAKAERSAARRGRR